MIIIEKYGFQLSTYDGITSVLPYLLDLQKCWLHVILSFVGGLLVDQSQPKLSTGFTCFLLVFPRVIISLMPKLLF